MIRSRLGLRLSIWFGLTLMVLLFAGLFWLGKAEERHARMEVQAAADQSARALEASLKTIMLAGRGTIAHDWLERIKRNTNFEDVRIYRRDGTEAFVDNDTIERVNTWLGEDRFMRRIAVGQPAHIPASLAGAFATAAGGTEARSAGKDHLILLRPIRLEQACLQCHGYDSEPVRGVLALTVPTATLAAELAAQQRDSLWVAAVILLLAGLVLLWLLQREVIQPLGRMQVAARQIKQGNLGYRVELDRKDELGTLAATLNRLVDHLEHRAQQQRKMSEAVIALAHETAGETVLRRVGELAMEITDARYCMLAYLKDGEKRFIPLGVDDATLARLKDHPPQGLGLLGLLWRDRKIMRVEGIADHPEFIGFPPGHPHMQNFLGAPIEFAGEMIGALYLADRKDGRPFSEEDEDAVRMLASSCAVALANARQYEALRRANERLESRVAERTQALADANRLLRNREIELELMNDELRQANETKNQFLANTSHELRTPLNAIIGFSDLLLATQAQALNPKQREYIEHINTAGRRLLELINSLLDLSKIEAGMLEINEEPASAGVLLDYTVNHLKPLADKKQLALRVNRPQADDAIYVDAGKLQQIWVNLIGNAIKFTPEGGSIEVGFRLRRGEAEGEAVLEGYVQDTGIGIKEEDLERIFKPFVQAEGGLTREHGGTGLGLALVRRLLEMQGGSIQVESTPGKGSRFSFSLPVRCIGESEHPKDAMGKAAKTEASTPPARPVVVEPEIREDELRPLILIVDDDQARAATVVDMLEAEGYRAELCGMGHVEQRAEQACPFLIMVGMPADPVDIYKRLHFLRSRKATRHIPLVLLGGDPEAPRFSLGTVDTVDKQMDRRDLVDLISRYGRHAPATNVMTVLVVDDDEAVREYVKEALRGQGYRILLAANGEEGLRAAIDHDPDLIILDLMMPGMSGFEVVEQLKRHPTACDIPVVIFTAKELTREEVMRLGQEVEKVLAKGATGRADLLRELRSLELLYPTRARLMDSVLRCYNPRYLRLRLLQECNRAERYGHQFSLVGWQMDGYEAYVREHGHRWGIAALKNTVELVNSAIRKGDVLVRTGEAEFTLILPGISPGDAERVAEKIRLRIRLHRFPLAGGEAGHLTASFGCAHFGDGEAKPEELLADLHRRMQRAAAAGGDCCICFDEEDA